MKRISLNTLIFLGAAAGVALGLAFASLGAASPVTQQGTYLAGLIGTLFVNMLKMIVIPLVFTSIAVGVANLKQHQQMHRVWTCTVGFFVFSMLLAIVVGLSMAHIVRPGHGLHLEMFAHVMSGSSPEAASAADFFARFLHTAFMDPVKAMAQGDVFAVVVFALILGVALVKGGERFTRVHELLEDVLGIMLMLVGWIMRLAPLGIMALLAKLMATQNAAMLSTLATFIAMVIGSLLLHGAVLLPLILYLVTGVTPWHFWRGAREALITAFATSSSAATLPVTLRCTEQHLHVKPDIAGFVIPLGATVNMDGTALYEAAAALFVANLVGMDLSLAQQLVVVITAMISAIGAPGIPSAGMVTMVMVLQSVGLPAEAIAILLPIDRLLDTFRTAVNVEGDMVGSLVVQKWVRAAGR
jgi:Na+/H+-dicarboxylate symporter